MRLRNEQFIFSLLGRGQWIYQGPAPKTRVAQQGGKIPSTLQHVKKKTATVVARKLQFLICIRRNANWAWWDWLNLEALEDLGEKRVEARLVLTPHLGKNKCSQFHTSQLPPVSMHIYIKSKSFNHLNISPDLKPNARAMASTSQLPFRTIHSPAAAPLPGSTSFTVAPDPSTPTDIWRKPGPPRIKTFNAPIIYKSVKLQSFQRARVTVSAAWSNLYDQGGLVFVLPTAGVEPTDQRWIKTGIEFYEGAPYVSTVAADRWADWSLVQAGIHDGKVTLEMERKKDDDTLWIFIVDGQTRIPIREITWALSETSVQDCWVGVYAATPTVTEENGALDVQFEGWELEVRE
jgi:regulation of enolase protein 1 (concanavalin A-like superfamily)